MVLLAYSLNLPVDASATSAVLSRILRPEADWCVPMLLGLTPCLRAALLHLLVQQGHDGTSSPYLWHFLSQGVGNTTDILSSRGGEICVGRAQSLLAGDDWTVGSRASLDSVHRTVVPLPTLDSTQSESAGSYTSAVRLLATRGIEAAPMGASDSLIHGRASQQGALPRAILKLAAGSDSLDLPPAIAAATHSCSTSPAQRRSGPTGPQPAQLYSDNISWQPQFVLSSSTAIHSPAKRAGGGGSTEAVVCWSSLLAPAYLLRAPGDAFLHVQHSEPATTSSPNHNHIVSGPPHMIIPASPMSGHERRALYEPARSWFAVKARAAYILPCRSSLETAGVGRGNGKLYTAVQLYRKSREECGRAVRRQVQNGERHLREMRSSHATRSLRPISPPRAQVHHRVDTRYPSASPLQARAAASLTPATPLRASASLSVLPVRESLDDGVQHRCGATEAKAEMR
jgi:hypothetical protein